MLIPAYTFGHPDRRPGLELHHSTNRNCRLITGTRLRLWYIHCFHAWNCAHCSRRAGVRRHAARRGNYRQDVFFVDDDRYVHLSLLTEATAAGRLSRHRPRGWRVFFQDRKSPPIKQRAASLEPAAHCLAIGRRYAGVTASSIERQSPMPIRDRANRSAVFAESSSAKKFPGAEFNSALNSPVGGWRLARSQCELTGANARVHRKFPRCCGRS